MFLKWLSAYKGHLLYSFWETERVSLGIIHFLSFNYNLCAFVFDVFIHGDLIETHSFKYLYIRLTSHISISSMGISTYIQLPTQYLH